MRKVVGILGGMGPYATLAFYKKVLDLTPAQEDNEHLHLIIDSNPHIPSRNRHFIYDEPSPVNCMLDSIRRLKNYAVDVIYVPCNSASYFLKEIRDQVDVPLIGAIDATLSYLLKNKDGHEKISVWGAHIVYEKAPYKQPLIHHGLDYVEHTKDIQQRVENLIYSIKRNELSDQLLQQARELLFDACRTYGMDILVLGCTELCLVFDKLETDSTLLVDSNAILAQHLIEHYA